MVANPITGCHSRALKPELVLLSVSCTGMWNDASRETCSWRHEKPAPGAGSLTSVLFQMFPTDLPQLFPEWE